MGCAMVTGRILNWCHNCSREKVKVPQGLKSLCRNYECRPYGTAVAPLLFPGTVVPGFPVLPLHGWSSVLFHRFCCFKTGSTQVSPQPVKSRISQDHSAYL